MRLHAQTALIENGFVHLPERAPWLAQYLAELTAFPNGKHDDQVDSTAQMLDWFKGAGRKPGFLGYYRRRAEELRDPHLAKPAPL
jgi:phage terminase large subunit-like protein